jgi:Fic family protein
LKNVGEIDRAAEITYTQNMKNTLEHISFRAHWKLREKSAALLGQCYAYIDSILNIPIRPDYHRKLLEVSLNKGALATTAIEGNTLTEEELSQILKGIDLAPSKKYQQQEVKNIIDAFNTILNEVIRDKSQAIITPELIKRFNKMVGRDIGVAFNGNPGQFRRRNVTVGAYRPPSFEMVEGLVKNLCDWLLKEFHYEHDQDFNDAVIEAIVTHVYIAWIHPFLDGNGRTSRLLEFYLLMRAGVPNIASYVLSNHYNNTRTEYYRQLQNASETGNLNAFIEYALEGFRDGLEKILGIIHADLTEATWKNYVHDVIDEIQNEGKNPTTLRRIRQLAYYIPADRFFSMSEIKFLNPRITEEYIKLNEITLRRDLELLVEKKLLVMEKSKYSANYRLLQNFLPEAGVRIKRHY